MTVLEIVTAYLRDHGYDGLYNDDCGCRLDDLVPCDGSMADCRPGAEVPCDCDEGCPWHIGPRAAERALEEK